MIHIFYVFWAQSFNEKWHIVYIISYHIIYPSCTHLEQTTWPGYLVRQDIDWSFEAQSEDDSQLEWLAVKVQDVTIINQPVYTQRTLLHGIFYPLFSWCWWSGSPTNTMFILDVKEWVMVKKVGKESTLFCLGSFKSHSTFNISYTKQFNYWPSPGNQQPLEFVYIASITERHPVKTTSRDGC